MADSKISALTDGSTAELSDRMGVARDPTGTPVNRWISVQYIITKILSLANSWGAVQTFTGGTIAAPGVKIGSAQTGLAVDTGTASQLSLVYAGTEHIRIGFNSIGLQASSGVTVSSSNGVIFGSSGSSSVPRLDPSSTTLRVRLGDGSADTDLQSKTHWLTDGVTAPSATVGVAKIFVDTADGDLKVIFGDGTVKTIVVDT